MMSNTLKVTRGHTFHALADEFLTPIVEVVVVQALRGVGDSQAANQVLATKRECVRVANMIDNHGEDKIFSDFLGCWVQVSE